MRVILAVVGEEVRDDLQRGQCLDLLRDLACNHRGFVRLEYLSVDDEEMKLCTREGIKSNEIDIIVKYNWQYFYIFAR